MSFSEPLKKVEAGNHPVKATQISIVRSSPRSTPRASLERPTALGRGKAPTIINPVRDPRTGGQHKATFGKPRTVSENLSKHNHIKIVSSHRRCNSWGSHGDTRRSLAKSPKSRSPSPAVGRVSRSPSPRPLSGEEQLYMQGVGGKWASPVSSPRVIYKGHLSNRSTPPPGTAQAPILGTSPRSTISPGLDSPTRRLQKEIDQVNDELELIYAVADNIDHLTVVDADGRKPGECKQISKGSPSVSKYQQPFLSPKQNRFFMQPPQHAKAVETTRQPLDASISRQQPESNQPLINWGLKNTSAFSSTIDV